MDLIKFIEDIERAYFRTNMDTGANMNTLFVWNRVREYAGLPRLTHDDLSQRHADHRGITLDEQKAEEKSMDSYSQWQSDTMVLSRLGIPREYWPTNPWRK